MARRFCGEPSLPYSPAELGDRLGLTASVLGSLALKHPDYDPDVLLDYAGRIVTSISYLAGAEEAKFVDGIDAYVRVGNYGLRVAL
jgi:hypothetical protein